MGMHFTVPTPYLKYRLTMDWLKGVVTSENILEVQSGGSRKEGVDLYVYGTSNKDCIG